MGVGGRARDRESNVKAASEEGSQDVNQSRI